MSFSNWIMRRLLSFNRYAAKRWCGAPNDGVKWTISALAWRHSEVEVVNWIDEAFWIGHCKEAFEDTMSGRPIEISTRRAKVGAFKVIIKILRNWRNLPQPRKEILK